MIKTVLFDLDDTIFDHKHSRICGLIELQKLDSVIAGVPLEVLESEHEILIQNNYVSFLDGSITIEAARTERTRQLFLKYGVELTSVEANKYTEIYKQAYEQNRRAVPGAVELITELSRQYSIGIVSNGMREIQLNKLEICKADKLIDFITLSEDVGVRKPDAAIFKVALNKCGAKPNEAVFIGDAWGSDISGAANCGIKAIWLNRYKHNCPDGRLALEINSYDNIALILEYINKI